MRRAAHSISGRILAGLAAAGMLAIASPVASARSDNVFLDLAGTWSGAGVIVDGRGQRERIRCRVSYGVTGDGQALSQNLVCASASYRFNVTAAIYERGGKVTGTWNETTRGVGGAVRGYVSGNRIVTAVAGPGFTAGLTIVSSGNVQSVSITPRGADITAVSISFRR